MSGVPLMARRAVRVARPPTVLRRQLLDLDPDVLAEAALVAARRGDAELRRRGWDARHLPQPQIEVRRAEPDVARGCFLLPMRWKVAGHALLRDAHVTVEARPLGPADVEVEVRLLHRPLTGLPDGLARAHGQAFVEAVTESFARQVFWTLEAHSRQTDPETPAQYPLNEHSIVLERA